MTKFDRGWVQQVHGCADCSFSFGPSDRMHLAGMILCGHPLFNAGNNLVVTPFMSSGAGHHTGCPLSPSRPGIPGGPFVIRLADQEGLKNEEQA